MPTRTGKLTAVPPPSEITEAAHLVLACHEGLKTLDILLSQARAESQLDCRGLHFLISPLERQLFSAADALAPYTGIDPRP